MVFVHHLIQEIVDIQLCTTINNGLHLTEQILKLQSLSGCYIVKSYLTVNGLDNLYFQDRLLRNGADTEVGHGGLFGEQSHSPHNSA